MVSDGPTEGRSFSHNYLTLTMEHHTAEDAWCLMSRFKMFTSFLIDVCLMPVIATLRN